MGRCEEWEKQTDWELGVSGSKIATVQKTGDERVANRRGNGHTAMENLKERAIGTIVDRMRKYTRERRNKSESYSTKQPKS